VAQLVGKELQVLNWCPKRIIENGIPGGLYHPLSTATTDKVKFLDVLLNNARVHNHSWNRILEATLKLSLSEEPSIDSL